MENCLKSGMRQGYPLKLLRAGLINRAFDEALLYGEKNIFDFFSPQIPGISLPELITAGARAQGTFPWALNEKKGTHTSYYKTKNILCRAANDLGTGTMGSCGFGSYEPNTFQHKGLLTSYHSRGFCVFSLIFLRYLVSLYNIAWLASCQLFPNERLFLLTLSHCFPWNSKNMLYFLIT